MKGAEKARVTVDYMNMYEVMSAAKAKQMDNNSDSQSVGKHIINFQGKARNYAPSYGYISNDK